LAGLGGDFQVQTYSSHPVIVTPPPPILLINKSLFNNMKSYSSIVIYLMFGCFKGDGGDFIKPYSVHNEYLKSNKLKINIVIKKYYGVYS
jgi:hypothetical protein